jgi:hypothetical protein
MNGPVTNMIYLSERHLFERLQLSVMHEITMIKARFRQTKIGLN